MKIVLVRWRDAFFDPDQTDPSDFKTEYEVQTVGFVVQDDEDWLSVAQEELPGREFRAITHIPKSVIESTIQLGRLAPLIGLEVAG